MMVGSVPRKEIEDELQVDTAANALVVAKCNETACTIDLALVRDKDARGARRKDARGQSVPTKPARSDSLPPWKPALRQRQQMDL